MKYHKIQTVFKRNPEDKRKSLLQGEYSIDEFEYLKNCKWEFTEKVDGTNIRIMWDGSFITYGGRTDNAAIPANLVNVLTARFSNKESLFKEMLGCKKVVLFGEGYGSGIQKRGSQYRKDNDFALFDVNIDGRWLSRKGVEGIAGRFELDIVPVIGTGTLADMVEKCAKGFTSGWGDFEAEGIVARPSVDILTSHGERIIVKLKCKDFSTHEK